MRLPKPQLVRGAALAGVGLTVVMMVTRGGPTTDATAPSGATQRGAAADATAGMPATDLKLELLESARGELGDSVRNPFRFQARPAPPAPRAATPPPAAQPAAARPPVASGPPPPPPIPLRFIGLFDAPGQSGRVAIMSDGRGNVFQGREGDIIEGRYRLGPVSADSLELSYTDGRGRQVVRLSGQ